MGERHRISEPRNDCFRRSHRILPVPCAVHQTLYSGRFSKRGGEVSPMKIQTSPQKQYTTRPYYAIMEILPAGPARQPGLRAAMRLPVSAGIYAANMSRTGMFTEGDYCRRSGIATAFDFNIRNCFRDYAYRQRSSGKLSCAARPGFDIPAGPEKQAIAAGIRCMARTMLSGPDSRTRP